MIIMILLSLFILFLILDKCFPLPIKSFKTTQTILSEDGQPLWRFADENGIWRYPVALAEVPDFYIQALLSYEDRWFYLHCGINPLSMIRALFQYAKNQRIVSGGSTLTMQVARIIDPHKKTLWGKLHQIFRAFQLEWHYSKDEILTFYLNRAPYGGTLEGIGAASWTYLGKSPSKLTYSDAALLAVLPQAPSRLRPDRYPRRAQVARDKVLDRLRQYEVWSKQIIDNIRQEEVWSFSRETSHLAPLLARRLHLQYPNMPIIKSTIDISLQSTIEDIAINMEGRLPPKGSMAILVVDHTDMKVKAYIGSIDFNNNQRYGQVDMIQAWRSPGSTLKPFLYGLAIDNGMIHSESLLQDIPRLVSDYRPANFDTGFNGPVSASEALSRSLNIPAVQLLELYGSNRFTAKLYQAGLQLKSFGKTPNISYILGGASTRLDQLVAAYSAFARHGEVGRLRFTSDEPLFNKPLLSRGSAWIIRRILAADKPIANRKLVSNIVPLAYKTGTSYGYRDAWAIGINARYLIGIWVGRPDGTPVAGQYGRVSAVPILQQVHQILLNREYNKQRILPSDPQPDTVNMQMICWPTGEELTKDDNNCHRQRNAWILNGIIPQTLNTGSELQYNQYQLTKMTVWINEKGYRVAADCPNAQKKQIAIWPIGLEKWLIPNERRDALIPEIDSECPIISESHFSPLVINGLIDQQELRPLPDRNKVRLTLSSLGGKGQRWWFLDGQLVKMSSEGQSFEMELKQKGRHSLLLMDEVGQIERISFTLE